MPVNRLVRAFENGDWQAFDAAILEIEVAQLWNVAAQQLIGLAKPHSTLSEEFHKLWTVRGHHIRAQVADDFLMLDVLHVLLPTYTGPSLTLYRGESAARWSEGLLGIAWSSREETARMFGGGLNALYPGGGVLLSTDAPAEAIIASPSRHSIYLDEHEYVVDRRRLGAVRELDRFWQKF